ncbi:MAG: hypothetical protein AAB011_05400 [Candidatus Eisenbacteria bacterium]
MIVVVVVVLAMLVAATASAVAAYRWSGSAAWNREYNAHDMGLAIEVAFLFLTFASSIAIALIMKDSFRALFLEGGWRTPLFLGSLIVVAGGVSIYMLAIAPGTLAAKQKVAAGAVGSECRRPYLYYTPFSVISWVGAVLPVLALIVVSIGADSNAMGAVKQTLGREGAVVVAHCENEPSAAKSHAGIYSLAYRESLDAIQRMVSRYLWVIGVFMISIIVILNTRITSSFTEESQDAFKWLTWLLLVVALGVCLFGFSRYQIFRDLAIETQLRLQALAAGTGNLDLLASSREALLALRNQGPVQFLQMTLESGSLGLMFFGYAAQIVLAKVTHRSVLGMIFPGPVARFLDSFMLSSEQR